MQAGGDAPTDDGPGSWLRTKYTEQQHFHVMWGAPSGSNSNTQDSDSGHGRAQIMRTAALIMEGSATTNSDSSELPRLVFASSASSPNHSSTLSGHAPEAHQGENLHVLFPDDSASDLSEEWCRRHRSNGTGMNVDSDAGKDDADRAGVPAAMLALHDVGRCKPCMFLKTAVGCASAGECDFCHLPHRKKAMQRPCKSKRDRFKALLDRKAREAGVPLDVESGGGEEVQGEASVAETAPRRLSTGPAQRKPGLLKL